MKTRDEFYFPVFAVVFAVLVGLLIVGDLARAVEYLIQRGLP